MWQRCKTIWCYFEHFCVDTEFSRVIIFWKDPSTVVYMPSPGRHNQALSRWWCHQSSQEVYNGFRAFFLYTAHFLHQAWRWCAWLTFLIVWSNTWIVLDVCHGAPIWSLGLFWPSSHQWTWFTLPPLSAGMVLRWVLQKWTHIGSHLG